MSEPTKIDEIRECRAAITRAPWRDEITEDGFLQVVAPTVLLSDDTPFSICGIGDMEGTEGEDHINAEFIAAAPAYIDYLLGLISESAIADVLDNANTNAHKKPNMRTLWEEISEATLASRGKHEHPLRLELTQIAGICINMIRQIDAGEEFKP